MRWMNVRLAQDPRRTYGVARMAAWAAFRKVVPWQQKLSNEGTRALRKPEKRAFIVPVAEFVIASRSTPGRRNKRLGAADID